ncbi:MAG: hypothetical protein QOG85_1435 [Gaiellaceae bacterium]|jgi:stage II sporulation protein D|nr:hypothetical protein [Gaiellaceae bacterium]
MKSRILVIVAMLAALCASSANGATTLIVTGHGWGHGVGMSQWGAYGYALHGWKYSRILFHYYPGTTIAKMGEPRVRVLLREGAGVVTVGCATRITVTNGHGFTGHLAAKTYGVSASLALPVDHPAWMHPFARGLAVFSCGRSPLRLDGRPYKGTLALRSNGTTLDVVNALKLDQYVRGVVPSESSARWPIAELEAQAVAARSYAVTHLHPSARYDLVPDTRDQVYGGVRVQKARSNKAVLMTKGEVLMYDGEVARTYYSSSSGGRTEAVEDAWPGATPIPYLRSVPDPYDTYSPNHDWGPFVYSPSGLASALGVGGSIASLAVERDSSLRVADVHMRLLSGQTVTVGGRAVTQALGLKSTWFSIGRLTVRASASRVLYGQSVRVVARAIHAKPAVLQQRRADGRWLTVRHVYGSLALSLVPNASTAFRLRIPGVSSESVNVAVKPQLRVHPDGPNRLAGQVLPRVAGPVRVWRRVDGVWKVVARPYILQDGTFRTPLRLRPTTYRITAGSGEFAPVLRRLVITRSMLAAMTQ